MLPEKIHVALNHLPLIGFALALIPLLWGVVSKHLKLTQCGILLVIVSGVSTGLIMGSGEEAGERYRDDPDAFSLDSAAREVIEEHDEIAHQGSKLFYATTGLGVVAFALTFFKPVWYRYSTGVMILLCISSIILAVIIADSGGKIRRPDFREEKTQTESL
ncbi:MAG: hypothetical protein AAFY98_00960 [Verrucomicrobiota bacterium]